ncbi:aliphatic sulfonate ABC transporter substrate-binding protein [Mangrovibacillus cuniculi]|uniref:Putative aliphatic sulfonates-binding protein n=1 Tax=Mangrovibacillus cuniculi TaxID=2593652 RepID=A0A7S8HG41_9BACI|nr:aliphatic sulfonate ABC transporter substrate-binding protein [Mangrovibacillus cuniculi]QPC47483.1 aliphatic sulfonate ABC transporter substrate-binding protein [Mangrovibacillus cuniculi]
MKKIIWALLTVGIIASLVGCSSSATSGDGKPSKIVVDYAYYSPTSLVLKDKGFLEKALEEEGVEVEYVLSQGSNKALEFLNAGSIDFGSTAGAASFLAKSNGSPIEAVYSYSKPEWTALVTTEDSEITKVEDLKGKKVAATLGTDPYIFLLRALKDAGLSAKDVEIVNLQHSDGAAALLNNQVDAWAGLDPHMAKVELGNNAKLFHRNPDANTYGILNVRSEFAKQYPEYVDKVIAAYEEAREWAIANPEETAALLAEEAGIDLEVAKKQLERNDFSNSAINDDKKETILEAGRILQEVEVVKPSVDVEKTVDELLNDQFTK